MRRLLEMTVEARFQGVHPPPPKSHDANSHLPVLPSFPIPLSAPFSPPPLFLPLPSLHLEVGPLKSSYGSRECCELPQSRNRIGCISALKYRRLVATILIIFLTIKWPNLNFVPQLPYFCPQGFLWRILHCRECLWTPLPDFCFHSSLTLFRFTPSSVPSLNYLSPPFVTLSSFLWPSPRSLRT